MGGAGGVGSAEGGKVQAAVWDLLSAAPHDFGGFVTGVALDSVESRPHPPSFWWRGGMG